MQGQTFKNRSQKIIISRPSSPEENFNQNNANDKISTPKDCSQSKSPPGKINLEDNGNENNASDKISTSNNCLQIPRFFCYFYFKKK